MKRIFALIALFLLIAGNVWATDQILATEEMVGAGHATKADTLNRALNKLTTAGDMPYATAAQTITRLGIGTAGQVLKTNAGATAPEWGSLFGAWDATKAKDTVYQAATDGLVTFSCTNAGAANVTVYGLTDAANPPTTTIIQNGGSYVGGQQASITFPVRKGDFWKVAADSEGACILGWLPIGG